ncbi:crotonase/enoyl-CoA hydratase family protein [Sphingobium sp. JS3065]|uniref:crotonase/enoyl-CoA hydratase family protein n=1 Tax=Sphingobium sp. JS3065 TaxID=2970925 RepID=UPI002264C201|nr:crotonase/enoyl-CoA hydratase family protein [Sphingobium sp. JS3065]UZW56002.1 crotonase/enoyl-CoA hydratase family protein [Sphingobium sp. JS3065]
MTADVLTRREDGILVVTINRPDARNAANKAVAEGIAAAADTLDGDDSLRVGILTGAGGTFCSGMDLKAFVTGERPVIEGRGFCGIVQRPPLKPLIAAVEGYALAGGFELAIACDLIVAAANSKFGIPEAKRGLVANAGGLLRLPRQIPPRIAKELALTGEFLSAERALQYGLINAVAEPGGALDLALDLARKISANAPLAIAASKRVIDESQDWSTEEMFDRQAKISRPIFDSADAIEGAKAFAEKRAPNWKGI